MVLFLACALALSSHARADEIMVPGWAQVATQIQAAATPLPQRHLLPATRRLPDYHLVQIAANNKVIRLENQIRGLPNSQGARALNSIARVRMIIHRVVVDLEKRRVQELTLLEKGGSLGYDVNELKDREEYLFQAKMDFTYGWFLIQPLNEILVDWARPYKLDGFPIAPEFDKDGYCRYDLPLGKELSAVLDQLDPSRPREAAQPGSVDVCAGIAK
jgi:hypothetical protein